jgi:hypothetical protein
MIKRQSQQDLEILTFWQWDSQYFLAHPKKLPPPTNGGPQSKWLVSLQTLFLQNDGDLLKWFSIGRIAQLAYQDTPKIVEWKIAFIFHPSQLNVIWTSQNGACSISKKNL